jgi:hypothetical protein
MCRHYSREWGTHYYTEFHKTETQNFISHEQYDFLSKESKENWKYSHYVPKDPDEHVFVITDHLALLSTESGMTPHQTMGKWSYEYGRKQISKHWKWTICNVVQQAADSEKQQFDFKGNSIVEKIKPSLDGLGNNKELQRDHLVILGLFAPARYNINMYLWYDVGLMDDRFRTMIILKN